MIVWSYTVSAAASSDFPVSEDPTLKVVSKKDFALDLATGDLEIPLRLVDGADAIAQRLLVRMSFFKGEWFLDTRLGIPYLENVFVRNPDLPFIEAMFRKVIKTTPGVDKVLSYTAELTKRREYLARAEAKVGGSTIVLTSAPFIVGGSQ